MRSDRYDENQDRAVLLMPIESKRLRRMLWEIVSKAAVRSRRMSIVSSPESAAIRRSLVTLTSAVSVLWSGRKPD